MEILSEIFVCCILVCSDIRDARSQDPVARRRLADLIRDACINVRSFESSPLSDHYFIHTLPRLDFFMVSLATFTLSFIIYGMTGVIVGGSFLV